MPLPVDAAGLVSRVSFVCSFKGFAGGVLGR
jgi:hypothetical protein